MPRRSSSAATPAPSRSPADVVRSCGPGVRVRSRSCRHGRFDGVLAFQSKPQPFTFDDFLRQLDHRLTLHSRPYRELCEDDPNAAVFLKPSALLTGQERFRHLRDNLVQALDQERLLLVLDNFETQLEKLAGQDGRYACADPQWDALLAFGDDELAQGLGKMPDLFTPIVSEEKCEAESRYLEDVAVQSVDLLLERTSPEARQLLWMVTLASEPMMEMVAQWAWGAEEASVRPWLAELVTSGLLTADGDRYAFHELVRERAEAWMEARPAERGGRTAEQVWVAYGEIYSGLFQQIRRSGEKGSRDVAVKMGLRGISYFVRAGELERLGSFASGVVISTRDPALLGGMIAELEGVVDQVPAGESRWSLRIYLADALRQAGLPDASLGLYEPAASEAEEAGDFADVGVICGNWANALSSVGQLDA